MTSGRLRKFDVWTDESSRGHVSNETCVHGQTALSQQCKTFGTFYYTTDVI